MYVVDTLCSCTSNMRSSSSTQRASQKRKNFLGFLLSSIHRSSTYPAGTMRSAQILSPPVEASIAWQLSVVPTSSLSSDCVTSAKRH